MPPGLFLGNQKRRIFKNDHPGKAYQKQIESLELAEYLKNVSEACKVNGVSRQHFYDIKKAYEEGGLEGLREKSRRKPCIKNRVAPEIEEAVVRMAYEYPGLWTSQGIE